MVSLADAITNVRFQYHLAAIDVNNALNQLKLRSNEKADECAKKHTMTIFNDILPRLGYNVESMFKGS